MGFFMKMYEILEIFHKFCVINPVTWPNKVRELINGRSFSTWYTRAIKKRLNPSLYPCVTHGTCAFCTCNFWGISFYWSLTIRIQFSMNSRGCFQERMLHKKRLNPSLYLCVNPWDLCILYVYFLGEFLSIGSHTMRIEFRFDDSCSIVRSCTRLVKQLYRH